MSQSDTLANRWTRFQNRLYARLAQRQRPASGFVVQPEPRTVGSYARGRQLVAGNLLFSGYLVEAEDTGLWDVAAPNAEFEDERQGFTWLDDLAAVGDMRAREKAQRWVWGWIDAHGKGMGPGWAPDLTGRRVTRWINHAIFLLRGADEQQSKQFFRSLAQQSWFLSKRWKAANPGLPRFEALAGLVHSGLALEGLEAFADPALRVLAKECERQIDKQGGIPTRNPEELLEVFTLLSWTSAALSEVGRGTPAAQTDAIRRIAPTLRNLRHADGALGRFHGGGRGVEGRLDQALAQSGVKHKHSDALAMGFARLSAARTTVIIDASPPPTGTASYNGHASTLAFELTSGRRPLIVNCGSGTSFGREWRRAGRATPSHSTLCVDGYSSARLADPIKGSDYEALVDGPRNVPVELEGAYEGARLTAGHDGYNAVFGLTHARTFELRFDGRELAVEDILLTANDKAKRQFERALDSSGRQGVAFDIRLHLHPDVDAALDLGGAAVSMALKSGEIWVFRHDGGGKLSLEPSVYLEKGRLKPRATKQIVLSARAMEYATRIRWTLRKAQDTAYAVRDLHRDEPDFD
ncbi:MULTISPECIES: heparinase II/III family protein [unclassified Ruegeria]|uniref:heparinase II/III family protein n=1 Tax=unclassified Ruegeria TaxID=2625375 RepID=UPI001489F0A9|nr:MULTISPECIES: heparinase II/III family protein [unclassified Ruegeria]